MKRKAHSGNGLKAERNCNKMLIQSQKIWTPDNSNLLRYKAEIDEGKILVGQELYQELENLVEDLFHNEEMLHF